MRHFLALLWPLPCDIFILKQLLTPHPTPTSDLVCHVLFEWTLKGKNGKVWSQSYQTFMNQYFFRFLMWPFHRKDNCFHMSLIFNLNKNRKMGEKFGRVESRAGLLLLISWQGLDWLGGLTLSKMLFAHSGEPCLRSVTSLGWILWRHKDHRSHVIYRQPLFSQPFCIRLSQPFSNIDNVEKSSLFLLSNIIIVSFHFFVLNVFDRHQKG